MEIRPHTEGRERCIASIIRLEKETALGQIKKDRALGKEMREQTPELFYDYSDEEQTKKSLRVGKKKLEKRRTNYSPEITVRGEKSEGNQGDICSKALLEQGYLESKERREKNWNKLWLFNY